MSKELEFKNFEIKAATKEDGGYLIEGYASVFDVVDSYRDVIVKGAFKKTIKENFDRLAFCYQHDIWNPIGKILEAKEDKTGLYIKVMISSSEVDIQTKIDEGILKEMSIGFQTIKAEDKTEKGGIIRYIQEVKLYEVSIVTIAANPYATISKKSEEERIDIINKEFNRIIALERNEKKKYDLLLLKSLITTEPINHSGDDKPTNKEVIDFDKLTYTN